MKDDYLFPELLLSYINCWSQTPSDSFTNIKTNKQKDNDKSLVILKRTFLKWLDQGNSLTTLGSEQNQKVLKDKVMDFMVHTLEIDKWVCELLDQENYYEVSHSFINRAKEQFKDISFDDIYQALRNIWVIIALQIYMNSEVKLTDAMFAYSMLYPLTDNYLDNPDIPITKKESFNKRFQDKISSNIDKPANEAEKIIFNMIDLIESDFSRDEYPDVFKSLLAILDGQKKSLEQHSSKNLSEEDLLHYTFYKGGTSVLADAYLVRGDLTSDEAAFAYGYGIVLQLADDLQDICCDLKNHHDTPYNQQSTIGSIDDLYRKHENFTKHFMNNVFMTSTEKQRAIYQLLDRSLGLLFFGGVCDNRKCFSGKFRKSYFLNSRFSCKSFNKLNKKITNRINL